MAGQAGVPVCAQCPPTHAPTQLCGGCPVNMGPWLRAQSRSLVHATLDEGRLHMPPQTALCVVGQVWPGGHVQLPGTPPQSLSLVQLRRQTHVAVVPHSLGLVV
jgi:hypothetical protein